MGRTLSGRQALYRSTLTVVEAQELRAQTEHRRASLAYLFWPAALYEQFAGREQASSWYCTQVRQAVQFGNRWLAIGAALLLWPLFASLLAGNATIVIVLYVFAIALDIALFVVWLRAALRYSRQAARGETFSLRG